MMRVIDPVSQVGWVAAEAPEASPAGSGIVRPLWLHEVQDLMVPFS